MNINGDGLTDLLSYNAATGLAVYSIATGVLGEQKVVKQVTAAKGWTSIVPMDINGDGLTDLLSYNARTGLAIYSIATVGIPSVAGIPGDQKIVKQVNAATGWTSIVPMDIDGNGLTDLVSYNATTGLAAYSVATGVPGEQRVVKQVNAAKGWTSIVPMLLDANASTDLLSYNATTGLAVYSTAGGAPGEQEVVRQVTAAKGWTSIVPIHLKPSEILTDLLSYNAATGLAVYSTASGPPGDQNVVKQVNAATGWTSVVPMELNGDGVTDFVSYNMTTGRAVYSIGEFVK